MSFSRDAENFGVTISAVSGPAGTVSRIEQGAIDAAEGQGASTLTITATMVKDSMARLLKSRGFTQVIENGQATANWTKTVKLPVKP